MDNFNFHTLQCAYFGASLHRHLQDKINIYITIYLISCFRQPYLDHLSHHDDEHSSDQVSSWESSLEAP
jgi:hypothetical protein